MLPAKEVELSPTLLDMVRQGKCTLFAGPLLSQPPRDSLGPPTPAWLAFEMAERMQIQPEIYDLQWVAQLYADREGKNALRNWVAQRLNDVRYCPTLAHHLIAQLPFSRIVQTAHDRLLRLAHDNYKVPFSIIQSGGSVGFANQQRIIVQFYGSADLPETLKLTEDERRHVWEEEDGLGNDLRTWARSDSLLFLGYAVNDPQLGDLYYRLRSQNFEKMPRAYVAGPGVSPDYIKHWEQRNVTVYPLDATELLGALADKLQLPTNDPGATPQPLNDDERSKQEKLRARFEYLLRLNTYVETSAELRRRFAPHVVIEMTGDLGGSSRKREDEMSTQPSPQREEMASLNKLRDGNLEWSQGNLDLAREYFEDAIQYNPKFTDAYLSLFHLLIEKHDLKDALLVYQKMLKQAPEQAFLPERYEIRQILGENDLGVSYCVFDREQNSLMTATVLRRVYAFRDEDLSQFVSQLGSISSAYISRVLGSDRYRGRTYLLAEYFDAHSLRQHLGEGTSLPYPKAMQIARQIADALHHGHQTGIPHLNLQPSNILLDTDGIKLVSYGFSRLLPQNRMTARAVNGDSYDYLSPEQLARKKGDERSDIYALGTILYEMLTGHTPGVGSFQQPSETNPEVTESVDVLIDHARERYPDKRFASAADMRTEIDRITLATFGGWFGQYIRAGLAWISNLYEKLVAVRSRLVLIPFLIVLLAVSLIPAVPDGIAFTARIIFPILLNSILVSVLCDWAVRAIARRRGLGSLIRSGRGMGAVLGLIFTIFLVRDLGLPLIFQETTEMAGNFGAMLALVLFLAAAALGLIMLAAHYAERWWHHYTLGFYWGFLAIVGLMFLATLAGWPCGLIGPSGCN